MHTIHRRLIVPLAFLAFLYVPGPAIGQTTSETVAQYFPQSLIDLNASLDEPLDRHQCFQVLATDPSGSAQTIVATYTNGYRAVVRVLQRSGDGFQIAAEPSGLHLWGLDCSIELANLTAQQRIVHLTFHGAANTVDWVFVWTGQELSNLTPLVNTDFGNPDSQFRNAELIDLDGDGALDVTSRINASGDEPTSPTKVFRWTSGGFVPDLPILGPWTFVREDSSPTTDQILFELPSTAQGPFTLFVVNGTGTTGSRVENAVESARVWLNGEEVLRPSDFGANIGTIERAITLQQTNQLDVRLGGTPGGIIVVKIKVSSWSSQ